MATEDIKKVEIPKKRVMDNTMYLINKQNRKVGEVEEQVGVSTGYFSRLAKDENSTKLGLNLVAALSEVLSMPMDILCRSELTLMTPTESKIVQFSGRLTFETVLGSRRWSKETQRNISEIGIGSGGNTSHPLFKADAGNKIYYNSEFAQKRGTKIVGDIFSTSLGNGNWFFLVQVQYPEVEGTDFEGYICSLEYDNFAGSYWGSSHPVCATNPRLETGIDSALKKLYQTVVEVTQHTQLDDFVNSTIDNFLSPPTQSDSSDGFSPVETDELPF